jgi:hypothetical protein
MNASMAIATDRAGSFEGGCRPAVVRSTGRAMKKTFTIRHTNDIHSNLIGMGPARFILLSNATG